MSIQYGRGEGGRLGEHVGEDHADARLDVLSARGPAPLSGAAARGL